MMFDDLEKEMQGLKNQMVERGNEIFKTETKKIFEDDPNLKSFRWTQYTPYFNDGDECVFGVYDYYTIEFHDGTEEEDISKSFITSEYEVYVEKRSEMDDQKLETLTRITELIPAIPEEIMKDIFGDHAQITVYSDRVEVEEYQHD